MDEKGVKRIVACCGKVYYDLVSRARNFRKADAAIIRVEQLYPFPHKQFEAEMKRYPNADRSRVVPGRAAEPGRVVPDGALLPREHARRPEAVLCRPSGFGLARRRLQGKARRAAEGAGGAGFRKIQVVFINPARYAPGFSQPGGCLAEAGEGPKRELRWPSSK